MIPKVKDRMTRHLVEMEASANVYAAAQKMTRENIGSLFIRSRGEIIGIVTETDLVQKCMAIGLDPGSTAVEKVMSAPVLTIDSECSLVDANIRMEDSHILHLGVTEGGKIGGVLSIHDLLHPIRIESGETVSA